MKNILFTETAKKRLFDCVMVFLAFFAGAFSLATIYDVIFTESFMVSIVVIILGLSALLLVGVYNLIYDVVNEKEYN